MQNNAIFTVMIIIDDHGKARGYRQTENSKVD